MTIRYNGNHHHAATVYQWYRQDKRPHPYTLAPNLVYEPKSQLGVQFSFEAGRGWEGHWVSVLEESVSEDKIRNVRFEFHPKP